jgi:hypothetical protein
MVAAALSMKDMEEDFVLIAQPPVRKKQRHLRNKNHCARES